MNGIMDIFKVVGAVVFLQFCSVNAEFPRYVISTLVGTNVGTRPLADGGPASTTNIKSTRGVWSDSTELVYFSDAGNKRVRIVNHNDTVTTFAGGFSGTNQEATAIIESGSDNYFPATSGVLATPQGLFGTTDGIIYITDSQVHCIRRVSAPEGLIVTIAGNGKGASDATKANGDGGPASSSQLKAPASIFVNTAGLIYFAENSNKIRMIDSTTGIISLIAGEKIPFAYNNNFLLNNESLSSFSSQAVDK